MNKQSGFFLLTLYFLANVSILFAQERGVEIKIRNDNGKTEQIKLYKGSYALVIGNSDYTEGWRRLPDVKRDVAAIKSLLEKNGFTVETAEDLTRADFLSRFENFINSYGLQRENRLLIYYAGHGYTTSIDNRTIGSVVMKDAPLPETSLETFERRVVDMAEIEAYARRIKAKHALFVFDSCFSGTLLRRGKTTPPPYISLVASRPVRQFITSGSSQREVPDESIFRVMFERGLGGDADLNRDGYVLGTELALFLQQKVANYTNNAQTPLYGKINDVDLDMGDFVFVVPTAGTEFIAKQGNSDKIESQSLARQALNKLKAGEVESAIELSNKALALEPKLALALAIRGHARRWFKYMDWENPLQDEAKKDLESAVRVEPQNKVFRAWLAQETGEPQVENALRLLRTPQNALEHYALGIAKSWKEYNPSPHFEEAVELEPNFTLAVFELAYSRSESPNEISVRDYTRAIELLRSDCLIKGLAYYYRARDRGVENDEAVNDLTHAINIFRNIKSTYLVSALSTRAELYKRNREYLKALRDYTSAIEIDDKSYLLVSARAEIELAQGNYRKAVEDYTEAIRLAELKLESAFSSYYEDRAKAHEKLGEYDKAAADRQKANEIRNKYRFAIPLKKSTNQ